MCLAVYLAADTPLPLVRWLDAAPGFNVAGARNHAAELRRQLTKPYFYYIGSHTGCGCGFLYDGVVPGTTEHEETRSAYRCLAEYLQEHGAAGRVEIYTCWGGEEGAGPRFRRRVGAVDLASDGFAFEEMELLMVDCSM